MAFCNRIFESDRSIRFVGIANKMGRQIISSYRSGLMPLLTRNEIEMFATGRIEDEYKKILTQNLATHILICNISEDKKSNYNLRE